MLSPYQIKFGSISSPSDTLGIGDSYIQMASGINYLDYVGGGMGITAIGDFAKRQREFKAVWSMSPKSSWIKSERHYSFNR